MGVFKGFAEGYGLIGKLSGEGVGVFYINKCVQAQVGMARWVWHGRDAAFGFDEYLRAVAAYDGEKRVLIGRLESDFEAKFVAVEGDGLRDVGDDEGWGDVPDLWTSHKLGPFRAGVCANRWPKSVFNPHANVSTAREVAFSCTLQMKTRLGDPGEDNATLRRGFCLELDRKRCSFDELNPTLSNSNDLR